MRNFAKDIRFALRTLANNPGFAVIGIVTLALGMAANTTVFSVVNGFLLRPLPVPHPEQITVLALKQSSVAGTYRFSYPTYGDLRDQTGSFSDVFAYRVSLGVQPGYGRLLLPTERRIPRGDPIIVLGYSYWRSRFAGDPKSVRQKVQLNDRSFTVVGVAPREFRGTYPVMDMEAYVRLSAETAEDPDHPLEKIWTSRGYRSLTVMGRLKPGVNIKQAQASLNVVADLIVEANPATEKGIKVQLFPERLARP